MDARLTLFPLFLTPNIGRQARRNLDLDLCRAGRGHHGRGRHHNRLGLHLHFALHFSEEGFGCPQGLESRAVGSWPKKAAKLVSYIARKTKKVSAHGPSTVGITFAHVIPPAPSSALLGTRIRYDDAGSP